MENTMEEERGFKMLSVAPRSHQDQSQRVNRQPDFPADFLRAADFISVPEVGTAMISTAFVKADGVLTDNRGAQMPRLAFIIEITL